MPQLPEFVIRTAQVGERAQLEALQWRASLANLGDREVLLRHTDAIAIRPEQIALGRFFVAETGGKLLGFAAIDLRDDGQAELDGLFVEPLYWRRGIGRRLVEHCAGVARTLCCSALHVVGNPHAEGFYRSCGFRLLGTCQTRFGPGLLLSSPVG